AFAGQFGPQGGAFAMAGAFAGAGGPACGCGCGAAQQQARNWNVHGDPHISNPDGSKDDFSRQNGMFTLQDGTNLLIQAGSSNGTTQSVTIFDPGTPPQGFDANKTTYYGNGASGRFQDQGTVAQNMGQMG